ncbi:MAG: hypothetical protein QXX30_01640 [Candidatus Aenigmatarchaeota archaeon]
MEGIANEDRLSILSVFNKHANNNKGVIGKINFALINNPKENDLLTNAISILNQKNESKKLDKKEGESLLRSLFALTNLYKVPLLSFSRYEELVEFFETLYRSIDSEILDFVPEKGETMFLPFNLFNNKEIFSEIQFDVKDFFLSKNSISFPLPKPFVKILSFFIKLSDDLISTIYTTPIQFSYRQVNFYDSDVYIKEERRIKKEYEAFEKFIRKITNKELSENESQIRKVIISFTDKLTEEIIKILFTNFLSRKDKYVHFENLSWLSKDYTFETFAEQIINPNKYYPSLIEKALEAFEGEKIKEYFFIPIFYSKNIPFMSKLLKFFGIDVVFIKRKRFNNLAYGEKEKSLKDYYLAYSKEEIKGRNFYLSMPNYINYNKFAGMKELIYLCNVKTFYSEDITNNFFRKEGEADFGTINLPTLFYKEEVIL